MLSIAAREAEIIGIHFFVDDVKDRMEFALDRRVGWIQEAAQKRFEHLELNHFIQRVEVTAEPYRIAEAMIQKGWPLVEAAGEVDRVAKLPEQAIAAVEIDPPHLTAAKRQRAAEHAEKIGRHSLQKQETPPAKGHVTAQAAEETVSRSRTPSTAVKWLSQRGGRQSARRANCAARRGDPSAA